MSRVHPYLRAPKLNLDPHEYGSVGDLDPRVKYSRVHSREGGGRGGLGTVTSVNKRGEWGGGNESGSWGAKRVLARKGDTEREGATRGNHSRPSRLREQTRGRVVGLERKQRGGRMKKGRPALSFAREGDVEQERVPESPVCGRVACRSGETTQRRMVMARTNEKWRWWGCGVGIVGRRRDWWNGTAVVVPEPSSLSFAIALVSVGVGEPNVMVAFALGAEVGGWVVGSSRSGGGCGDRPSCRVGGVQARTKAGESARKK
ncbi:hypothetical protein BD779DRAFT_1469002 [Infundibulicybe gibba]|nr:hypothetical protein BD779DRAFT_1469002 [Infundibulicybe gibba]